MKIERSQLYQIGGIGMIVGAFFSAAKALGGALAFTYFIDSTNFSSVEKSFAENIQTTFITGNITSMVHEIGSILILIFGVRCLISGPTLIDRWIDRGEKDIPITSFDDEQRLY